MYTEKQKQIFEGVIELARQGVDLRGIKVQAIATAAGVGKGTLYEYFKTKDEILLSTLSFCIENELDQMEALLKAGDEFVQQLSDLQAFLISAIQQRGAIYRLLMDGALKQGNCLKQRFAAHWQRGQRVLIQLISTGRTQGRIAENHTDDYCVYTMITALAGLMFPPNQALQNTQRTEFSLQMILKALA